MISQESKNVMAFLETMKVADIRHLPIALLRKGLEHIMAFSSPPAECEVERVNAGGPDALWVRSAAQRDGPVLMYLHGGAYTMGSPQTHLGIAGVLSELAGVRVLSVDYRLAPENPYPAAVEDAVSAYRWLLNQGLSARSVVIGGDSAGGGLTFATLLALKKTGVELPAAVFALSPWVDLAITGETINTNADVDPMITLTGIQYMVELYAGDADVRSPLISPLYGDLTGLPPVLIHVGTCEMLLSDARRMAKRLDEAGVDCTIKEWEGMFHVFQSVVFLPEARVANEEIAAYIRQHIRGN